MDTQHDENQFNADTSLMKVVFYGNKTYTPTDALDGFVYAEGDVPIHKYADDGKPLTTFKKGAFLGKLENYNIRKGVVWWQLDNGMFIKSGLNIRLDPDTTWTAKKQEERKKREDIFDKIGKVVDNTVDAVDDVITGVGDLASGAGKSVSFIGQHLGTILIIVALIALLIIYFKYVKQ